MYCRRRQIDLEYNMDFEIQIKLVHVFHTSWKYEQDCSQYRNIVEFDLHTYIHTYTHTYIHTYIYIYIGENLVTLVVDTS